MTNKEALRFIFQLAVKGLDYIPVECIEDEDAKNYDLIHICKCLEQLDDLITKVEATDKLSKFNKEFAKFNKQIEKINGRLGDGK